ncbi:MAG: hypothetical protein ACK5MQ_17800 [Pikeienuella sp.]
MARTPISRRNEAEAGAALLEAALALGLLALIAAAGLSAFGRAAAVSAAAEAKLTALAAAENAIERASAPDFLARALREGGAVLEGEGWRVEAAPYADALAAEAGESPLALIRIAAEAGPGDNPRLVALETLRSLPR